MEEFLCLVEELLCYRMAIYDLRHIYELSLLQRRCLSNSVRSQEKIRKGVIDMICEDMIRHTLMYEFSDPKYSSGLLEQRCVIFIDSL